MCVCVLVYPTHLHWAADTLAVIPPTPWTEAQGPEWVRSNSGHEAYSELFHAKRLTSCTGTAATHNAAHATVRWWCMQKERGCMNTWVWSTTSHILDHPKIKIISFFASTEYKRRIFMHLFFKPWNYIGMDNVELWKCIIKVFFYDLYSIL